MKTNKKPISIAIITCCVLCIATMIVAYFLELQVWQDLLFKGIEETLLGIAALLLIIVAERKYYLKLRIGGFLGIIIFLLGFLIAAANFPFATLATEELSLTTDLSLLPIYIFYVFSIGLFEELAFRGIVFNEVLNKMKMNKLGLFLGIIITNSIFGLVHLLNLLSGGGLGATLLQVTYTFLIGCMCNIVMLFTGCLYWAVLLHAAFDFGGLLISSHMATGAPWNTVGAIIMTVVGIIVTLVYVIVFIKSKTIVLKAFNR